MKTKSIFINVFLFISAIQLALALTPSPIAYADGFRGAPPEAAAQKNPSPYVKVGGALFAKNCESCHGVDGVGMGNVPSLAKGPVQKAKDGEIFWFIGVGSPQNGMPPAKLSEKERWQVVSYIGALPTLRVSDNANSGTNSQTPAMVEAISANDRKLPAPAAPFTDFRFEKPGQLHKIMASDIPKPAPDTSVGNGPSVVARPKNAWPQVPDGFKVQLFAKDLENPRLMKTAPNGDIFLIESEPGKILVFRGVNADGTASKTETFLTGLDRPYGLAFYPSENPKWIYIGNTNAVVRVPYHIGDLISPVQPEKLVDLPNGNGHWTRDLEFSLDGKKLFVAVGSASNVDDPDTTPGEKNRADILVMSPEGKDVKIYASGIRNAGGGMAVQRKSGQLWASVNERDALGDNLVPDYITHVEEAGFYGWPWWYTGAHQDPRHAGKHPELKDKTLVPDVLLQPHHASLQLAFYDNTMFPQKYSGDIFSAQHGSWNRSVRTGYEVIRVPLHDGKATGEYEDFMTGFVVDNKNVWGRPVGVTVASDGALLVSDDGSNSIWRVIYSKK